MSIPRITARRAYIWTHRTLGFALGIFFVVLGITGTLLVYRGNVDALVDPAPYAAAGGPPGIDADRAAAVARAAVPGGRLVELIFPRPEAGPVGRVYQGYLRAGRTTSIAYVDPHAGRLLAVRPPSASVSRWVHDVHQDLLLGKFGENLVALLGVGLLATTLIGVMLWPGWHNLRSGLSFKRDASTWRWSYDLHKILGIFGTAFLLFFAVSGVILTYKGATRAALAAKLPQPPKVPAHTGDAPAAPIAALVATAQTVFPHALPRSVSFPALQGRPVSMDLIGADDIDQIDGNKRVYFDPVTGAVLGRLDNMTNRYGITDYVYALHAGRLWASPPALALDFLLGLLPVVLLATAVLMWALRKPTPPRPLVPRELDEARSLADFPSAV